jgi:hypothetical protein
MADAAQQAGENSKAATGEQPTATVVQEAPPPPPVQEPPLEEASQPGAGQGPEAQTSRTPINDPAEGAQATNTKANPSAPPAKAVDGSQTIENKTPIRQQINVQGQASLNFTRERTKKEFKDPTKDLPSQIDVPAVSLEDSKTLIEVLKERRVIVLASFEHQISFAAAHSLARQETFSEYERRLLVVAKRDQRADVTIDLFGREEYHEKKKQVILIEINHDGLFLDSLRTKSCGEPAVLRDLLRRKDIVLICAASFEVLGVTPEKPRSESLPFDQRVISFLDNKLTQCFPQAEALQLKDKLIRLRQDGLWATSTEEEFFRQVTG